MKVVFPRLGVLLSLAAATPALGLRGGGRTGSVGDRKIEVSARCGEPSWREERTEETGERVSREAPGGGRGVLDESRVLGTVEEWAYNFGPHRLL